MDEFTSVPNSLREQIANAQKLLSQSEHAEGAGNSQLAIVRAQEGMKALRQIARGNPELATVLSAIDRGFRGLEYTEVERTTSYRSREKTFLGISVGYEIVPETTVKTFRRTVRLI